MDGCATRAWLITRAVMHHPSCSGQPPCAGTLAALAAHRVVAVLMPVACMPAPMPPLPPVLPFAVVIELQSGGLFGGDTIGTVQVRLTHAACWPGIRTC